MNFETVNISLTLSTDALKLIQIAISHLAEGIIDGDFSEHDEATNESVLSNLNDMYLQFETILNKFA